MATVGSDNGGTPITGGGGYPPPAHVIAGIYYDANWNEVNADGSPKTAGDTKVTYRQVVDTDGSLSGVPGATVQVSSTGSVSIISRPSTSGGGGGGGAASQAGRYSTQVDTTGAITGIPGAVYQQDSVDGSITIVSRPSATTGSFANPLDKNNDGLNDSTGWANGVFKDSSSPSGFYYASNGQYIPVTPDGAPYNGPDLSGGGANAKTWTGQGPKGYGTYYLDGAGGTPGTFIGDTRAPSASSAAVSGSRASGGSSGGSSGSSAALSAQISADAAAARQAADQAFQQQQAADGRLYSAQQAQLDRQLRAAEDAAQNEKDRAAIQNQRAQLALQATQQFQQAVSSTDPIAFAAFLAANGNISNGLANGQTALSDRALVPAANILQLLNSGMGLQDLPSHDANYYLNQGGGGTGTTNTTGGGGLPTGGTGTTGGTGGTTGAGGTGPTGGGSDLPATGGTSGSSGVITLPPGYEPNTFGQKVIGGDSGGTSIYGGSGGMFNFDLGAMAGVPLTVQQRNDFANAAYQNFTADAYAGPNHQINNASYVPYVTQTQYTGIVGSPPPPRPAETFTDRFGNLPPTQPVMNLANDQINHVIPTQGVAPNITRMASGGRIGGLPTRNLVPTIVGDRHDNKVSGTEELALLPPGAHVLSHEDTKRALGGTTGLQRALKGGLPRAATGVDYSNLPGYTVNSGPYATWDTPTVDPNVTLSYGGVPTGGVPGYTVNSGPYATWDTPTVDPNVTLSYGGVPTGGVSTSGYLPAGFGVPTPAPAGYVPTGGVSTSGYLPAGFGVPTPAPAGYVVQQYPNEQGHYETQYIGGYPTNVWVANPSYNASLNQYGQPIQAAPPPPAPAPQPTPAPVQQPSGGTVSPVPTPPPATTPTTATGGLPTSTTTTSSSSTPPLNTTPGPTVTTPSGTTTQLPSPPPPAPTTNTTGGGLPTGGTGTTATPPLTGTAQNAVNTLPSQYTSGNLVTPDNQAYVDYVRNLRTGVQYPNLNMYSVDYASIDPTVRDIYEKGLQDQFGIPQSSSQFEQQKYQLRGLPTGAASVTY